MKRKIGFFTIIVTLLLIANSCELGENNQKNEKETSLTAEQISILVKSGKVHNQGVDFIVEQIRKKDSRFKNRNDILNFIRNSGEKFVLSNYSVRNRKKLHETMLNATSLASSDMETTKQPLSSQFKGYLNQIYSVKYPAKETTAADRIGLENTFEQKVIGIRNEAINNLNKKEAINLIIAASTYRYSSAYWNNSRNQQKWIEAIQNTLPKKLLSSNRYPKRPARIITASYVMGINTSINASYGNLQVGGPGPPWWWYAVDKGELAHADVGGALGGIAAAGLTMAFTGPMGWAAFGAFVAGGAAAGSVQNLYTQVVGIIQQVAESD